MKLFQIRTRPDLQSEYVDFQRVIAEDAADAMNKANVPDFTLLTAVEIVEPGFHLSIDLGNAAMLTAEDVADAVSRSAEPINAGDPSGRIYDANGNTVGHWVLTLPEPETQTVKARDLEEGQQVKIGDDFSRIECVGEMPGDRVEVITEPYSEGVLWEGDQACEILLDEEAV